MNVKIADLNNSMIKWIWILWGFILLAIPQDGQTQNNAYFEHLDTRNGLSQSDVNCLHQDKEGYIWIGTHDGLNRYDGYDFTIFKPSPEEDGSISSNLIFDIVGDKNDNLWIATTGGGLNHYDKSTDTFYTFKHSNTDSNSISSDHLNKVFIDKKHRLWIATNRGIDMLEENEQVEAATFIHYNLIDDVTDTNFDGSLIYTIFEDSHGQILVGGHNGLFILNKNEKGKAYFQKHIISESLSDMSVSSIIEDQQNRLFIGSTEGLFMRKNRNDPFLQVSDEGRCNQLAVDPENNIWCGTNNGLLFFENGIDEKLPVLTNQYNYNPLNTNAISKNIIRSLLIDRTGILWVGTNGGGINKYDPTRKRFKHARKTLASNSLSYDKIRSIYEDSRGNVWVGTEGGGLNRHMEEKDEAGQYNNFQVFKSLSKSFALEEVEFRGKKTLYIGIEGNPSLAKLDISDPNNIDERNIEMITDVDKSVFALLEDRSKTLWIGTYAGGVHRWILDKNTGEYNKTIFQHKTSDPRSLSSNIIRYIFQDSKGAIWFATGNGLSMLPAEEAHKQNPIFTVFKNDSNRPNSISHNYIMSIYEDSLSNLWVGTLGGGLNKVEVDPKSGQVTFISYTEKDGLPSDVIKGILEDDQGHLWMATNKGLSRFNIGNQTFKNFDVNDGLQDNEFQELACYRRKNGEMLFGGVNGFNAFFPADITDNKWEPETVLTNFAIFNKSVKIGQEVNDRVIVERPLSEIETIHLKYNENSISFSFASLHYASPQKNQFEYKLEGYENEWQKLDAKQRKATFTNLDAGKYTFKVRASNNDGLWDPTPAEISIVIKPAIWNTRFAYVVYLVLAVCMLLAYGKYTIIKKTKKKEFVLATHENEKFKKYKKKRLNDFTNNLQPLEVTVKSYDELFVQKAIDIVEEKMMDPDFNVEGLVSEIGYSRSNLHKKFKEVTGLSTSEFIRYIRLKKAKQLFDDSGHSVKEIMYKTGFNTASYFAKCFKKQFGCLPSEYAKQHKSDDVNKLI